MHTASDIPQHEIKTPCPGQLHPKALRGLRLFNQGKYFEAHEALEEAWRAETSSVRILYQGILQIGVAYYHILRGNYRGAINLLQRGSNKLKTYPDTCSGIDIAQLCEDVRIVNQILQRLRPEGIKFFDQGLLKPIILDISTHEQQK